jgi:acetyl esterase/lipase
MAEATGRRDVIKGMLAVGASVPLLSANSVLAQAAAAPSVPLNLIHPDLRAAVPMIDRMDQETPELNTANLAARRDPSRNRFNQPPLETVPYERRMIPGGRGQPDVGIYIVNAKPGTSRPAILHTHGGGYVLGSAVSAVRGLQELCAALDVVVVSVDYRLAPETTYAGSIEDNYAGLKWLHDHATELGGDPARIAVMGESAGGGHAALLAITARDRGEVPLAFQCLIYPMLDDRTGTTRRVPAHVGTLIWTAERNRFGWESFLGTRPGGSRAPRGAVPARVVNLAGLPPAFIGVGTLDLFCDEDIDYSQRLNAAGVLTELIVVPGAFHGFDALAKMAGTPLGTWFESTKYNALRRGLGLPLS